MDIIIIHIYVIWLIINILVISLLSLLFNAAQ